MSSIKIIKARICEVLQAALPHTQVIYGPASADTGDLKDRILTVGDIERGISELDNIETSTEIERYVIKCVVSVDVVGSDQRVATEAADDDWTTAKRAIREYGDGAHDLGLGETVQVFPTTEFDLNEKADRDGRHAMIKFGLSVVAQVS